MVFESLKRFGLILAAACLSTSVQGAFPEVYQHSPLGIVRGEEATLTLYGDRLGDIRDVLFHQPGFEVAEVTPIKGNKSATIKVKVNADLAPGLYPFQVVTASGVGNLRFIGVGVMPVVQEAEPNNSFEEPQSIPMDRTIEGNVDREDVDCFRVDLKAGQRLTVEVEAIRHASDLRNRYILDPFVAILNEDRFEVAVSDDSSLHQQDGVCTFTPEEDGSYTIMLRESSFLGQKSRCRYRMHIGSFPRPTTVLPAGGVQGELLKANLIDIDGSVSESSVQVPSDLKVPAGQSTIAWPVITEDERGVSPTPNWIRVGNLPTVMEAEPNDDYRKGQPCSVPALLCGVVNKPNDYDCFAFECKKGEKYRVQLYARETLRSPLDGVIHVFDTAGKAAKGADDVGGKMDGFFDFTVAKDGTHTVRVYDHLRSGSPLHNYVISVDRIQPSFKLDLKELRRDESMKVPVPIGGNGAMVVTAKRDQFNEAFDLEIDGLPEGVTAQTFPMPKGRIEIPVVLTASADAKLNATLFDVTGKGKLGDKEVVASLRQHHKIVLGQNRREMFGHDSDRAAVAVCEKMPFEVELVQPKTPILRRGSKELLVRIKRDEGFDGPVYFKTLYNPPGVGVNNSRKIDKGQTEVKIPITANKSAAIGTWPIVMQVTYAGAQGSCTVATSPIMLEIEDAVFNYEFNRAAGETGSESIVSVKVSKIRDITGEMEVQLVGLPNGVTCPEAVQKIQPDQTSISFPVAIDAKAKTGRHKTLVVQTRVKRDGETMVQTDGTGEIRVDKPIPVKKDTKPAPKKAAPPKKDAKPKPLSRLEQLRQQKEAS